MIKRLCIALVLMTNLVAKAQVPNGGFEILNSHNNTAFWGEAHLITIWIDSSGSHGDSILYDDPGGRLYFPTTDAYQGNYALELRNAFNYTTGYPMVGNAKLSADSNDYSAFGGNLVPVNFHPLTLDFYYKYFPVNSDTAIASISVYDSMGVEIGNLLIEISDPAPTYTYMSRHIDYTLPGTAAWISMEFRNCKDGNAPSFGTRLQIDEVNMQTVGLKEKDIAVEKLICYPVPATDLLKVRPQTLQEPVPVHILNELGQVILSNDNGYIYSAGVDVSTLSPGVYFVEIFERKGRRILRFEK